MTEPRTSAASHDPSQGRVRRGPAPASSWLVSAYIALLTALLVTVAVLEWRSGIETPRWFVVGVLALLGALGASLRERELGPSIGVSFGTVVLAAALPLTGPIGAAVVGYLNYLCAWRPQRLRARLFNASMSGCMGATGGIVYVVMGGVTPLPAEVTPIRLLTGVALPLVVGYSVMTLLNCLLIGGMARLVNGVPALSAAKRTLSSLGPLYFTHALIAFLFVVLWVPAGVGLFSVVLILGPLLIAQWTLSRDAEERRSHSRTVTTLVAALETASPYSEGHSGRVAALSSRIGRRLGITGEHADELHFAALLHDIGLVAVAPRLPQGEEQISVDYLASIGEHSEAGVRMLKDIDFLREALPGILHHHERVDGRGYPSGLVGEEIPLFARVIAVADAFDSLTATRSYRDPLSQDQALAELRQRSGTQLDGHVVEALASVLSERPWQPTIIAEHVRVAHGTVHDHDDPRVSDLYAAWSPHPDGVA